MNKEMTADNSTRASRLAATIAATRKNIAALACHRAMHDTLYPQWGPEWRDFSAAFNAAACNEIYAPQLMATIGGDAAYSAYPYGAYPGHTIIYGRGAELDPTSPSYARPHEGIHAILSYKCAAPHLCSTYNGTRLVYEPRSLLIAEMANEYEAYAKTGLLHSKIPGTRSMIFTEVASFYPGNLQAALMQTAEIYMDHLIGDVVRRDLYHAAILDDILADARKCDPVLYGSTLLRIDDADIAAMNAFGVNTFLLPDGAIDPRIRDIRLSVENGQKLQEIETLLGCNGRVFPTLQETLVLRGETMDEFMTVRRARMLSKFPLDAGFFPS